MSTFSRWIQCDAAV